jgi:hypothetical protein
MLNVSRVLASLALAVFMSAGVAVAQQGAPPQAPAGAPAGAPPKSQAKPHTGNQCKKYGKCTKKQLKKQQAKAGSMGQPPSR